MKTILYFLLITPTILFSQVTLEDYEENRNIYYGSISGNFDPPGVGSVVGAATNPDQTGANSSQFCGRYTRNLSETYDFIVFSPYSTFTDLEDFLNETKFIKLDIWSPVPNTKVQIAFENSSIVQADNFPDGRHSIYEATTTTTNSWETLTLEITEFRDNTVLAQDVDQGVILINPETPDNSTYYIDNLIGPNHNCIDASTNNQIFDDFECQRNGEYSFSHGTLQILSNPDPSEINSSDKVGKYSRSDFKNNDVLIFEFNGPLSLANNEAISMKIWSSVAQDVLISLQDASGTNVFDQSVLLLGNSSWQEYTFNYTDINTDNVDITKAIILFGPEQANNASVFYFDDFSISESTANVYELQNEDSFIVKNNIIHFKNSNSNKQIRILDLLGKTIVTNSNINSTYSIENKGMLLINIIEDNNSTTFKYLNY